MGRAGGSVWYAGHLSHLGHTRARDVQIVIPLRRLDEDSETQTCTDAREREEKERRKGGDAGVEGRRRQPRRPTLELCPSHIGGFACTLTWAENARRRNSLPAIDDDIALTTVL